MAAQKAQKIDVKTPAGKTEGSVELPAELFDAPANIALMHQVVTAQLAAARQGTHSTKTRGEVRGGGRKPYRQKGTGRARQGSTRAPQFTGGGVAGVVGEDASGQRAGSVGLPRRPAEPGGPPGEPGDMLVVGEDRG